MSEFDPIRLAKLLEMAGHPSSVEGEALNSLRAARSILAKQGRSLGDLVLDTRSPAPVDDAVQRQVDRLRIEIAALKADIERLRSQNARLKRENARIEGLEAELQLMREAEAEATDAAGGEGPITPDLVAVFDLLSDWRSLPDLVEKLGVEVGSPRVRRIIRLLDDKGLLRSVESWPVRYRLRFRGELSEEAKAFQSRIEDAAAERVSTAT